MAALLDLAEQALNDIRRADGLPVFARESVERQAGRQVMVQAGHGAGIAVAGGTYEGSLPGLPRLPPSLSKWSDPICLFSPSSRLFSFSM